MIVDNSGIGLHNEVSVFINRDNRQVLTVYWEELSENSMDRLSVMLVSPEIVPVESLTNFFRRIIPFGNGSAGFVLGEISGTDLGKMLASGRPVISRTGEQWEVSHSGIGSALTLLCREENGFFPHEVRISWTGDDVYRGRRVGEIEMIAGGVWPSGRINRIETIVDQVIIASKDGCVYPTSWHCTTKTHCANGDCVVHKTIATVKDISFNQKFTLDDALLGATIPDGTPVNVAEAPQLDYVWSKNWPVPRADLLQSWRVNKRSWLGRFWTPALLVVGAVLGTFLWLRLRK